MASVFNIDTAFSIKKWIKTNIVSLVFLLFLVSIAYINSLGNEFISDDIFSIVENKNITDLGYILTHPIRWGADLPNFVIRTLFGLNPMPYRLLNIVFHMVNTWLIYFLLTIFSNKRIAFFTAVIFAVHPILVESVAWISGGPYVLYTTFFLLSFLFYIFSEKSKKLYAVSLFIFLVTLLSNNKAVSLPFVFLLYELARGQLKKNWMKSIPYFLMVFLTIGFFFPQLQERITTLQPTSGSQGYNDARNPLLTTPIALYSYFVLLFFPKDLTLYHSELIFPFPMYFLTVFVFLIYGGFTVYFYKKNKFVFFWLAFFLIPLLPTLTPLGISWLVAERYAYLSSLSFAVLIAFILNKLRERKKTEIIAYVLFGAIVVVFLIRTILRNIDWKDGDHLWIATAKTSPTYHVTHNNLGDMYARHGDYEKAIYEFTLATKIKPDYADAYHNVGNIYAETGRITEAMASYKKAIKYNPSLWQSHQNLGILYFQRKEYEKARSEILQAISVVPDNESLQQALQIVEAAMQTKN